MSGTICERTTANIAADLRRGSPHSIVAHEAADRLDELQAKSARQEAIIQQLRELNRCHS